jgi:hypothetical protein
VSTAPASTWARRLALGVGALALVEWVAAAMAYRDRPDASAWRGLAESIAARDDDAPVLLATEWLGPSARMHVPAVADLDALARADLHGMPRFHTVGFAASWSRELQTDLEDLPAPQLLERRSIGPFEWASWAQPATGAVLGVLVDAALVVHSDAGSCRGRGPWRCSEGELARRIVEVDYRPRTCLGIEVHDGTTVTLGWPRAQLGGLLRGHLGFGDYNARLRDDAPVRLVVRVDGEERLHVVISDREGWRPFAIATVPGEAEIEIEVTAGLSGTWQGRSYDATPRRTVCLEARTIGAPQ